MSARLAHGSTYRGPPPPNGGALDMAVQQLYNRYLPDNDNVERGGILPGVTQDLRRRTSDEQFRQILAGYFETPKNQELQRKPSLVKPVQPTLPNQPSPHHQPPLPHYDVEFVHSNPEMKVKKDSTVTRRAPSSSHDPRFIPQGLPPPHYTQQSHPLSRPLPAPPHSNVSNVGQGEDQNIPYMNRYSMTFYPPDPSQLQLYDPEWNSPLPPVPPPRPSAPSPRPPVEYTTLHPIDQEYTREYIFHSPVITKTESYTRRAPKPPISGISPIRPHKFPRDLTQITPHDALPMPPVPMLPPTYAVDDMYDRSSWEVDYSRRSGKKVRFNEIVIVIPAPAHYIQLRDQADATGSHMEGSYGNQIEDNSGDDEDEDEDDNNDQLSNLQLEEDEINQLQSSAIFNAGLRGLNRSHSLSASFRHMLQEETEDPEVTAIEHSVQTLAIPSMGKVSPSPSPPFPPPSTSPSMAAVSEPQRNLDHPESEKSHKGGKLGKSLKKIGRWFS